MATASSFVEAMTARAAILEAVRRNVRRPAVVLPPFLTAGEPAAAGYEGELPVAHFVRRLEAMGERSFETPMPRRQRTSW